MRDVTAYAPVLGRRQLTQLARHQVGDAAVVKLVQLLFDVERWAEADDINTRDAGFQLFSPTWSISKNESLPTQILVVMTMYELTVARMQESFVH